jgi:hypothetical protein
VLRAIDNTRRSVQAMSANADILAAASVELSAISTQIA